MHSSIVKYQTVQKISCKAKHRLNAMSATLDVIIETN